MSKEKPIIFSGEMVRAVLADLKIQTRRILKPQPIQENGIWLYNDEIFVSSEDLQSHLFHNIYGEKGSPYGAIYGNGTADRLWVRESWAVNSPYHPSVHYRADGEIRLINDMPAEWRNKEAGKGWRPSIHMPRWASRIILEITDIRIERLHDATLADLIAEGCPIEYWPENCNGMSHAVYGWFEHLWDSINRKRGFGWDMNPWVWVIEFSCYA